MYAFGDVLIINFPFSDGHTSKRRLVIVLKDTNDGDLLMAKITSQFYNTQFDVSLTGWVAANLIAPSVVRLHKIQTIHSSLIFGYIGRITDTDRQHMLQALKRLFPVS